MRSEFKRGDVIIPIEGEFPFVVKRVQEHFYECVDCVVDSPGKAVVPGTTVIPIDKRYSHMHYVKVDEFKEWKEQ